MTEARKQVKPDVEVLHPIAEEDKDDKS